MSIFRLILDCVRNRKLPLFVIKRKDGLGHGKCARCGAPVTYQNFIEPGKPAFHCTKCGESGTWTA